MKYILYESGRDLSDKILLSENKNNAYPAHFHRNIEMIYMRSGRMEAVIDKQNYIFEEGDIVYVPSYYSHEFSASAENDVIVLLIPYEFMSDISDIVKNKNLDCKLDHKEFNRTICKFLELMLQNRELSNRLILKGFVNIIFGMLYAEYPTTEKASRQDHALIVQILEFIEENYRENITLDLVADKLGYNKFYISKIFKDAVNQNLKNYINIIRIQHIVFEYSKTFDENILSLVFQCGFQSLATFYRVFKSIYGENPKTFFNKMKRSQLEYNKIKIK